MEIEKTIQIHNFYVHVIFRYAISNETKIYMTSLCHLLKYLSTPIHIHYSLPRHTLYSPDIFPLLIHSDITLGTFYIQLSLNIYCNYKCPFHNFVLIYLDFLLPTDTMINKTYSFPLCYSYPIFIATSHVTKYFPRPTILGKTNKNISSGQLDFTSTAA